MKKTNCAFGCFLSTLVAIGTADAGIRVGNLSRNYAGTGKNTLALQQQYYNATVGQQQSGDEPDLPVRVADSELAAAVRRGDTNADTDMETLNKCAMIYPDGEFIWDRPTMGRGAGGAPTCVAVVEMRALSTSGGLEYTTVARGTMAAGDSINCNISDFPEHTYLPALAQVEFPADKRPTREDVIQVMNQEQKNKAGLKIAAAALATGIVGNMVGKSAPGSDSVFGTNSEKLKTTAGGMLLGGGLMAASTFSGKVAGDTILHAGINAAAGGVVGNMLASGNDVLRIESCVDEGARKTSCLWGYVEKTSGNPEPGYVSLDGEIYTCNKAENKECAQIYGHTVTNVYTDDKTKVEWDKFLQSDQNEKDTTYKFKFDEDNKEMSSDANGKFYKANIIKVESAKPAVIVDFQDSAFGKKRKDFDKWKENNSTTARVCGRNSSGNPVSCGGEEYKLEYFKPLMLGADDGEVVDLSNKARLGSTLKGAGAGAAVGGFAGYQGAQNDIEARFVQATREYNASLENFYCGTGKKFLSFYNDEAIVPAMDK